MKKVLVCGSNYGRTYADAIKASGSQYALAGLLARGSIRSLRIASQERVPLYRSVEEVPGDIDLACVAVGSAAVDVALQLLERGVPVLCEHPLEASQIQAALETAARSRAVFNLNSHFPDLACVRPFAQACQSLVQTGRPILEVLVSDRALFAALDLVRRSLGSLHPFDLCHLESSPPFERLSGVLGGARAVVSIQTCGSGTASRLPDGSPQYLVDLAIRAIFPNGILTLLSSGGPVVWNANPNRMHAGQESSETAVLAPAVSHQDFVSERLRANLIAMDRLVNQAETGQVMPEQSSEHLLEVAEVWGSVSGLLAAAMPGAKLARESGRS